MKTDYLSADTRDLLVLLNKYDVRFLVVSGHAVIHHGYARLNGDIDIYYDQTEANAQVQTSFSKTISSFSSDFRPIVSIY